MSATQKELDRRLCRRNIIIYGIILLSSVVWFGFVLYNTTKDIKRVRNWVEVPCLIKDVHMGLEPSGEFTTIYSWFIFYSYEYDGHQYTSRRYNIVEKNKVMDSDDQKVMDRTPFGTKPKVRAPYSVGDKTVCFVNPDKPSEAVLVREVGNTAIITERLLIPGVAVTIFLILLLNTLWRYWFWFR